MCFVMTVPFLMQKLEETLKHLVQHDSDCQGSDGVAVVTEAIHDITAENDKLVRLVAALQTMQPDPFAKFYGILFLALYGILFLYS